MRLPGSARWILLALAGLAIAIGVAIAAANLTSRQIGIASESVSAGDALAPALSTPGGGPPPGPRRDHSGPEEEAPTPTGEEPVPPAEEEVEPRTENGGDDSGGTGSDGDD